MENINWTDHVRNAEVLQRVRQEKNFPQTIQRRRANWIGHILRRNCILKLVREGKIDERIQVTRRRGRRIKRLLDDFKGKRGYWKLKEDALDRSLWRTGCGRGFGPVVKQ
jgi:hypothetical protein